jgi:hypothetical protein
MDTWAFREFRDAELWDDRCVKSLVRIGDALADKSGISFSGALGHALRQSAHRIFEDERVSVTGLLSGHVQETVRRCSGVDLVLVVQDSSELNYSGHKATEGLGPLRNAANRGLILHEGLALTPSGVPLGVVSAAIWARDPAQAGKQPHRNQRRIADKESKKWIDVLEDAETVFSEDQPLLLIQDREADIFAFLAAPRRPTTHLLVRAFQPRRVEVNPGARATKLFDAMQSAPVMGSFSITVPRKPTEKERQATLSVRMLPMMALPPSNQLPGEFKEPQPIWVVQATEVDTPEGIEPVSWTLITTMPTHTFEECRRMVEYYTRRWMCERFHYVLKSGCQVEKLQMDDAHTLSNVLAVYCVIAWRLLYITHIARAEPDTPAEALITSTEKLILTQITKNPINTASHAVLAIAQLGGYTAYKRAAPPGVKVLWIGLRQLEALAKGWELAIKYRDSKHT